MRKILCVMGLCKASGRRISQPCGPDCDRSQKEKQLKRKKARATCRGVHGERLGLPATVGRFGGRQSSGSIPIFLFFRRGRNARLRKNAW